MAQIMALDFGIKRTGIAVTDDMKLIASGLKTVPTAELMQFLVQYTTNNNVDEILVGQPKHVDGKLMSIEQNILWFIEDLKAKIPGIIVKRIDERFSSKMASQHIANSRLKKKKKQSKGLIDEISATILLQDYLNSSI